MHTRRSISRDAWTEYRATLDAHSPTLARMDLDNRDDVSGLGEVARATYKPPAGFVANELGFGFCEGPSIIATAQEVERAHRRGGVLLGDRSVRQAQPRKRRTGRDWQRTLTAHTGR